MKAATNSVVPVLITWDVDPDLWVPLDDRQRALNTAMDLCHRQGIRATFFVTARPADGYRDEFEQMREQGHEIGCHGLTHGDEENYDRMPEEMQCAYIAEATQKLQTLTGSTPRAFRSPRVKTSARTLRLLAECGYLADSSVCSQRMDVVSSNLVNTKLIFAPRRAYHPHQTSAFKAGDVPIWEVPVSAAAVPLISSALSVLGLAAMKALFRVLYAESRRTGKPIVYLAHPVEFMLGGSQRFLDRWKVHFKKEYYTLAYIRTHGLRLRNLLYHANGTTLLRNTRELFAYIGAFPDVKFMTISEYVSILTGSIEQQATGKGG